MDSIKSNRQRLFEDWTALSLKIRGLSGYFQNPGDIPENQIQEFRDFAFKYWNQYKELTGRVLVELRTKSNEETYNLYSHPESGCCWMTRCDGKEYVFDPLVNKVLEGVSLNEATNEALRLVKELGYDFDPTIVE